MLSNRLTADTVTRSLRGLGLKGRCLRPVLRAVGLKGVSISKGSHENPSLRHIPWPNLCSPDPTGAEENGQRYDFVYVDQSGFEEHPPETFAALAAGFAEYRS